MSQPQGVPVPSPGISVVNVGPSLPSPIGGTPSVPGKPQPGRVFYGLTPPTDEPGFVPIVGDIWVRREV